VRIAVVGRPFATTFAVAGNVSGALPAIIISGPTGSSSTSRGSVLVSSSGPASASPIDRLVAFAIRGRM
jgi:hypothetical protein